MCYNRKEGHSIAKNRTVTVRMTEEEHEKLMSFCRELKIRHKSDYIRMLIFAPEQADWKKAEAFIRRYFIDESDKSKRTL